MDKYFLPVYHSQLKPWIKWWILKRLNGGQSSLKAVTISSGTLTKVDKSKALSIKEYYGNTVQNGTPTPESPVEIQTISGHITFNINSVNYNLDLKSKQLFDKDNNIVTGYTFGGTGNLVSDSNFWYQNYYLEVEPNTTYYFSGSKELNVDSLRVCEYNANKEFVKRDYEVYTITTSENTHFIRISNRTGKLDSLMLSTSPITTYDSYYNYELCKIGDYKDKIYNDNGTWKVEKNIGKVVADSSYFSDRGTTGTNAYFLNTNITTCLNNNTKELSMCNMFKPCSFNARANGLDVTYVQTGRLVIRTANNTSIDWSTNATAKTWLDNNKPILYYALATPTTETITNTNLISQLNALYEFYVNSSTVTISNNSEIPLEVLLEYYGR